MNFIRLASFAIIATLTSFILIVHCIFSIDNPSSFYIYKKEKPLTILAFGDLMLDRSVREKLYQNGDTYPFENIKDILSLPDITFANLEGVFSTNKSISYYNNQILRFTFDKVYANTLHNLGFDIFSGANNHNYDFGVYASTESKNILSTVGIESFGDYMNLDPGPEVFEVKNKRIAFVGFHEFSSHNFDKVLEAIQSAKNEGDYVIVMPHWGIEYQRLPSDFQKEYAHKFIDNGADVVIGAHPHVIEPIEIYNNKPIFYSLGNFVFDQNFSKETTEGLGVEISIYKNKIIFTLKPINIIASQVSLKEGDEKDQTLEWIAQNSNTTEDIKAKIKEGEFILIK